MKSRYFFSFLLSLSSLCLGVLAADIGYDEQESQHVRITNNDDGSRTIFKRIPGQRQMIKRTYDPEAKLLSLTVYITDVYGETRSCKIYDGQKNELFKVAYGYDKFGRLVREYMYDSKTNEPVSVYVYPYGPDGKRGKAQRIVVKKGPKTDVFNKLSAPSALEKDPFAPKDTEKKPSLKKSR